MKDVIVNYIKSSWLNFKNGVEPLKSAFIVGLLSIGYIFILYKYKITDISQIKIANIAFLIVQAFYSFFVVDSCKEMKYRNWTIAGFIGIAITLFSVLYVSLNINQFT